MRATLLVVVTSLGLGACAGSEPVGPDDFLGQFNTVWEDFDRTYPSFLVKDIDWNATRARLEPRAAVAASPRELFDILSEMLLELEDGHVSLEGPWGEVRYTGWWDRFPHNHDPQVVKDRYLVAAGQVASGGGVRYASIENGPGYIRIPSFGGGDFDTGIEEALGALDGHASIVVDIRDNGGGNDQNARAVAARFADQRRLFRRVRYRAGPGHGDFTEPEADYIEPDGTRYAGRVALLTNRRVFSSSEAFVLAMGVLPTVVVVGDTTGGGSANAAERTLPVGFTYRVSRWIVESADGTVFEGVGIAPDVPVWITPADSAEGRDTILEQAIAELEQQGSHRR